MNTSERRTPALPEGIRAIRRAEPPAVPFAGVVGRAADGTTSLVVDADLLDAWPGWSAAPDAHILGPRDVIRRAGGHDVVLPLCTETLDGFLDRRRNADVPLTAGEVVTLAVSVLRGAREAGRDPTSGRWWLTDDGRPLFVFDTGEGEGSFGSCAASGVALIDSVDAAAPRLREYLGALRSALRVPESLPYEADALEIALFAAADAEPLATTVYSPARARSLSPVVKDDGGAAMQSPDTGGGMWRGFASHVDSGFAEMASDAVTAVWRRLRAPKRPGRRGVWIAAVSVAVLTVAVGVLWPSDPPSTAAGPGSATVAPRPSPTAARDASTSPAPSRAATAASPPGEGSDGSTDGSSSAPLDLVTVADGILTRRLACHGDRGCLSATQEDPIAEIPSGVSALPEAQRTVTLLDDFGGAAVLRVDAAAGVEDAPASQLVVIVEADGRWMLRDVHDVQRDAG